MFYVFARFLVKVLSKILFRLQVFGKENIPLKGNFIVASNHASYLDPPIVGASCPRVVSFLAKEELFKNFLFGRLISNLNAFPIKKEEGDVQSLRRAIRELRSGRGLVIFPEGRRTNAGQVVKPMRGVGLLATKGDAIIVPTFIRGSDKALPIHSKLIRPKKISVYFGRAFIPGRLSENSKKDFYQRIADKTMQEIDRLKQEHN